MVFVLTNGCYSDTHIVGIYSSEAHAKMAALLFNDDWSIQEYVMDQCIENMARGERVWFVRLNRETGDTEEIHTRESSYGAFTTAVGEDIHKNLYTHVWAKTQEQAVKVAGDRRRMFLAQPESEPAK